MNGELIKQLGYSGGSIYICFEKPAELADEMECQYYHCVKAYFLQELSKCEKCGDDVKKRYSEEECPVSGNHIEKRFCTACYDHIMNKLCYKRNDCYSLTNGLADTIRLSEKIFKLARRLQDAKTQEITDAFLPDDIIQLIIKSIVQEKIEWCPKKENHFTTYDACNYEETKITNLFKHYSKFLCVSKKFSEAFLYHYRNMKDPL
jgi:hypothetical protein